MRFFEFQRVLWPCENYNLSKYTENTQTSKFSSSFIDGIFVYRQGSQNMFHMFTSIYPLHFDVKYIHIRIHIIFHENFTQKTRSTASIYFVQGNSTAAAAAKCSTESLNLVLRVPVYS